MSSAKAPPLVRRRIDGVLLLDKPAGMSSNGALQQAKRLFRAEKAGHTGTLDPLATGLLPVCFGEATKFSQALLDSDKTYLGTVHLGVSTTTGDAQGEVTARSAVAANQADIEASLSRFVGQQQQVPPRYAALKYQGRTFYHYARAGIEIPRPARAIEVHELALVAYEPPRFTLRIRCSKGTYVRVLAEELGAALGCGAHLTGLRRLATGRFSIDDASTLDVLASMSESERDAALLPPDALLDGLPRIELGEADAVRLQRGQAVLRPELADGMLRAYREQRFLGVVSVVAGIVSVKRLLALAAS